MRKIKTIFKRVNSKVIDDLDVDFEFEYAVATEKVDGMNVRITMRNGVCVRLEKRRNPSKEQKKEGIIEPWYIDANINDPADRYLFSALNNTEVGCIPDGEWSAEAYGENIQGNPLKIKGNKLFVFSWRGHLNDAIIEGIKPEYEWLKENLKDIDSKIGDGKIEGIVWHSKISDEMVKIKTKDF